MSELLPNSQLLEEIPPAVWQALNHRAMGENWGKAAELAGIHVRTLKKYKDLPECVKFVQDQCQASLRQGNNYVMQKIPLVLKRLVKTALDDNERAYSRNNASDILLRYVYQQEELRAQRIKTEIIEQKIAALEGGKTINLF